jgi:hypothetical protein
MSDLRAAASNTERPVMVKITGKPKGGLLKAGQSWLPLKSLKRETT